MEFNLSEKIEHKEIAKMLRVKDVKEFIKRLKEELKKDEMTYTDDLDRLFPIIDKLAGKDLI